MSVTRNELDGLAVMVLPLFIGAYTNGVPFWSSLICASVVVALFAIGWAISTHHKRTHP